MSKTMQPGDCGAIQLAQTYGPDLVCVRHRMDDNGRTRHVTVELLINSVEIPQRKRPMVKLKLGQDERELRALILAAGGSWDAKLKLWNLPRRIAKVLKLQSRIVSA